MTGWGRRCSRPGSTSGARRRSAGACARVLDVLTGGVEPSIVSTRASCARLAPSARTSSRAADAPDAVADVACLSPSRFRHLLRGADGMALRPYILWRRFLRVWELQMAAPRFDRRAPAGFADAAHLSRTSRHVFGFPPSSLRMSGRCATTRPRVRAACRPTSPRTARPRRLHARRRARRRADRRARGQPLRSTAQPLRVQGARTRRR